jgi:hypothetical protein
MASATPPEDGYDCFDMKFPPSRSPMETPDIRSRLHVICALYAHTPCPKARIALLDSLEQLTLQVAQSLAVDLLENGWRSERGGMEPTYMGEDEPVHVRPQRRLA